MRELKCSDLNSSTSIEDVLEILKHCPPGPWPSQWATWPNVIEAHKQLVDRWIETYEPSGIKWEGDGIVIAGGGIKYFPSVWVNVKMIRMLGCRLPIQLWYLGSVEMDPNMQRMMESLGVECIDAREVEKTYRCRILCGWELKLFATLYSKFENVLFLDADNAPVQNVTRLFHSEFFLRHGAWFFPDYGQWTLKADVWTIFGMPWMESNAENERAFESGQYLIDKSRCEKELSLALFYAEHSDFTFKHVYGDKECYHLAWRRLQTPYCVDTDWPGWNEHTIVQWDENHNVLFQHRCQDKWRLGAAGNRKNLSLANEDLAFQFIQELTSVWDGVPWSNRFPTREESIEIQRLEGCKFLYRRVGYDERPMSFGSNSNVADGRAECEEKWWLHIVNGERILTLSRINKPTCHLKYSVVDACWVGQWLEYERMPVELYEL